MTIIASAPENNSQVILDWIAARRAAGHGDTFRTSTPTRADYEMWAAEDRAAASAEQGLR